MATASETANEMKVVGLAAPGRLSVSLLTPERVLFDGHADSVVVPGQEGEMGILPRHVTMVARLGAGVARITGGGKTQSVFVSGGFVQVADNVVTILTDDASEPGAIDRAAAAAQLEQANKEEAKGEKALAEKARRVNLARSRVRISKGSAN